ncbi:hypothetical protein AALO_G00283400 [Alosa alosa]|uniref:RFX1-4/6/8-like BCD domain-containing protein n=1 Tax=Alosa alosa TaxID=278164 RepID=A0AAV6FPM2_9TELE|nr:hypothetical protein AALO_G00283400 [Alosa alosa]
MRFRSPFLLPPLNHLAQAARAVLQNTAQINQMLSDLNRVDFANVQEQASWVCRCEDRVVQRLEQDFKLTLQQQNSLEQWAAWLDGVVSQVLKPYQSTAAFPKQPSSSCSNGLSTVRW